MLKLNQNTQRCTMFSSKEGSELVVHSQEKWLPLLWCCSISTFVMNMNNSDWNSLKFPEKQWSCLDLASRVLQDVARKLRSSCPLSFLSLECGNFLYCNVFQVGDFGLSKVKHHTLVSGGIRGTLPWMAPELLSEKHAMVTEKVSQQHTLLRVKIDQYGIFVFFIKHYFS